MSLSGIHLLIVDDDKFVRETLREQFELENARVTLAEDGEVAFDLICGPHNFDLILSDIRMPNCTGIELVKKIKLYNGKTPDIILMSAFCDINSEDAKKMGAQGIFMKKDCFQRLLGHLQEKKAQIDKEAEKKKIPDNGGFNILNFTIK